MTKEVKVHEDIPQVDEDGVTQMQVTPLLRFLRALDADDKERFAALVADHRRSGKSPKAELLYIYQIAGHKRPNPELRMAVALRDTSLKIKRETRGMALVPALTIDDLLIGQIPKPKRSRKTPVKVGGADPKPPPAVKRSRKLEMAATA